MSLDLNQLLEDLIQREGLLTNGYRDSTDHGGFTVGVGNMVPSDAACAQLPWLRPDGRQASPAEARACYAAVMAMPPKLDAHAYAKASDLRLSEDVCRDLCISRLQREFLPGLRRLFGGFDGYPAPAVRALVDMIYNLGEGREAEATGLAAFVNLRAACARGAWKRAAAESHRSTCRQTRNDWTRDRFLEAATGAG